jgi:glycerol uptake facilitator protein
VKSFGFEPKACKRSPFFRKEMKKSPSESSFTGITSVECSQLIDSTCGRSSLELSGGDSGEILPSKPTHLQEVIAEFIGTFIIVQIGCGTVCAAVFKAAQVGIWQIAAAWTIAVTMAISTTANVSGAHLNPAITFALALLRGFNWKKVPFYIIAQLLGAIAGACVNFILFHDTISAFEATNGIVRGSIESIKSASAFGEYWSVSSVWTAFLAEAYGTAMLAFVIFSLTNPKNDFSKNSSFMIPPLIGATVGALISTIAPLTQAGFNPARDFGPRIITLLTGWGSIAMKGWWLYVLAPLVGAPFGAFVADKILYR